MTQLETARARYLPARAVPIVKATDLGSVQVLKHSNRFLLTDSFGDIHPDSRGLGLYDGDTRVLACSVLRIGGIRPGPAADIRRGELPRRHPDDEPVGRSEPGCEGPSAGRAGRADHRHQPGTAHGRRGCRRAPEGREPRRPGGRRPGGTRARRGRSRHLRGSRLSTAKSREAAAGRRDRRPRDVPLCRPGSASSGSRTSRSRRPQGPSSRWTSHGPMGPMSVLPFGCAGR